MKHNLFEDSQRIAAIHMKFLSTQTYNIGAFNLYDPPNPLLEREKRREFLRTT